MGLARKQFTFYRSYYDAISRLPKKEQAEIILAVCAYALYETEPEGLSPVAWTAFELIRPTLDSGRKKAAAGMAGGLSKSKANGKQTAREKEVKIEKEVEIEKEIEIEGDVEGSEVDDDLIDDTATAAAAANKLQPVKGTLGQGVVFLTDNQMTDLLDKMGVECFDHYVKQLASFIKSKNANVKSHYDTILKWWNEDSQK